MDGTSLIIYRVVLVFLACLIKSLVPAQSAPDDALIAQIPGFSGTFPSKHYSGYCLYFVIVYAVLKIVYFFLFQLLGLLLILLILMAVLIVVVLLDLFEGM